VLEDRAPALAWSQYRLASVVWLKLSPVRQLVSYPGVDLPWPCSVGAYWRCKELTPDQSVATSLSSTAKEPGSRNSGTFM